MLTSHDKVTSIPYMKTLIVQNSSFGAQLITRLHTSVPFVASLLLFSAGRIMTYSYLTPSTFASYSARSSTGPYDNSSVIRGVGGTRAINDRITARENQNSANSIDRSNDVYDAQAHCNAAAKWAGAFRNDAMGAQRPMSSFAMRNAEGSAGGGGGGGGNSFTSVASACVKLRLPTNINVINLRASKWLIDWCG